MYRTPCKISVYPTISTVVTTECYLSSEFDFACHDQSSFNVGHGAQCVTLLTVV